MKYLGLEIYNLRIRILAAKMTLFYVKILPFASSDIINCLFFFSVQYIDIERIFKTVSEKSAIISRQELSFDHILKKCLIATDIKIISKKADSVLVSVYSSCTAEYFTAIL